jgi:hypothetical protein
MYLEIKKTAPGKNTASTIPRKKRTTTKLLYPCTAAVQPETTPQTAIQKG